MSDHDITPEDQFSMDDFDSDKARLMADEAMLDLECRPRLNPIAEMEIRFGNPALVFGEGDGDED